MNKDEALKLALNVLTYIYTETTADEDELIDQAITAIKEALAQTEQKYHRGDRLICLETEEYCVIHISGTDRQWVKFPDSHIGVYTNEQVAELFELLPKELEQEPVAWMFQHDETGRMTYVSNDGLHDTTIFLEMNPRYALVCSLYTTPPQRKPLTGWQPIETAQTTGREFILLLTPSKWPQIAYTNSWWTAGFSVENKPTHWMPIPPIEAAHGIKEKNTRRQE
jgi:hypothetical protein